MKLLTKIFPLLCFCFALAGCQKDDICPESTEVTPLLIIEFYDEEDVTRLNSVPNLVIQAVGEEDTLLGPTTTNRIAIPLRTDQSFTEYRFTRNSQTETENIDTLAFTYNPSTEYINRACGFKVNYLDLDLNLYEDEDNWILSELVLQNNVENETEAHISFTH